MSSVDSQEAALNGSAEGEGQGNAELVPEGESDEEIYEVQQILDVKMSNRKLRYRIRWLGYTEEDDTWETEESLSLTDEVIQMIKQFREENRQKINELEEKLNQSKGKNKRKQTWEYVELEETQSTSDTAPREMVVTETYYGKPAVEQAGEVKRLFDPTHKTSTTEIILAKSSIPERITRSQMRHIKAESGPSSRESSFSAAPSPVPEEKQKGRRKKKQSKQDPTDVADGSDETSTSDEVVVKRRTKEPRASSSKVNDSIDRNQSQKSLDENGEAVTDKSISTVKNSRRKLKKSKKRPIEEIEDPEEKQQVNDVNVSAEHSMDSVDIVAGNSNSELNSLILRESNGDCYVRKLRASAPSRGALQLIRDNPIPIENLLIFPLDPSALATPDAAPLEPEGEAMSKETFVRMVCAEDVERIKAAMDWDDSKRIRTFFMIPFPVKNGQAQETILHQICRPGKKCDDKHHLDDLLDLCARYVPKYFLNMKDNNGDTALHLAVDSGQICRVKRLLGNGCLVDMRNNSLLTPLDIAYRKNHAAMVKALLLGGADFVQLELVERHKQIMSSKQEKEKRAFAVLKDHSLAVSDVLSEARKRVFKSCIEVMECTQPLIKQFVTGPDFTFEVDYQPPVLDPNFIFAQYLVLHVCSFSTDNPDEWSARCWGGLTLRCAPSLNGIPLKHAQHVERPMAFYSMLQPGMNRLEVNIAESEMCHDLLVAQFVIMQHYEGPPIQEIKSGLEEAPIVGPI